MIEVSSWSYSYSQSLLSKTRSNEASIDSASGKFSPLVDNVPSVGSGQDLLDSVKVPRANSTDDALQGSFQRVTLVPNKRVRNSPEPIDFANLCCWLLGVDRFLLRLLPLVCFFVSMTNDLGGKETASRNRRMVRSMVCFVVVMWDGKLCYAMLW